MKRVPLFTGLVIMAACACGSSAGMASIISRIVSPVAPGVFYAATMVIGTLLFIYGIWSTSTAARILGLLAAGTLWTAGLLAPPRIMRDGQVFTDANMAGFALYLVALGLIIAVLMKLFQPAQAGWVGMGVVGIGLATGCPCCLTGGAIRFLGLEGGVHPSWLLSRGAILSVAILVAALTIWKVGRMFAFIPLLTGFLMVYPLEKAIEWLVPSLTFQGMNFVFLLRYPFWLVGTALLFGAAVILLRTRCQEQTEPAVAAQMAA